MLFFSEWSKPTVKGTEKEIDEKNGLKHDTSASDFAK